MASFDDLDLLSLKTLMSYFPLHQRLQLRVLSKKCLQAIDSIPIQNGRVFIFSKPNPIMMEFNDIFLSCYYPIWTLKMFANVKHLTICGNINYLDLSSLKQLITLELKDMGGSFQRPFQLFAPIPSLKTFAFKNGLVTLDNLTKLPNLTELQDIESLKNNTFKMEPMPSVQSLIFKKGILSLNDLNNLPSLTELVAYGIEEDVNREEVFPKLQKLRLYANYNKVEELNKRFPNLSFLSFAIPSRQQVTFEFCKPI